MNKILVAVIAYNEEKNIRNTIEDLRKNNSGFDIIVIDNGSIDKTKEICENIGVNIVSHCINSDINGTWKTYFLYAYLNNYDIVCQFDGDGQHLASELPIIIEPIVRNEADFIIGSRFIDKKGFQSYFIRRLGINIFSIILSIIIRKRVKDVTSGFIAFNRNVIEFFAKYYKYEIDQTMLLCYFAGARIIEMPVQMRERIHGKSFFGILNSFIFPFKSIVNIFGIWLIKNLIKKEWTSKHEP
jgi:glycosyltransferase involved in cell wall biosynthesis